MNEAERAGGIELAATGGQRRAQNPTLGDRSSRVVKPGKGL